MGLGVVRRNNAADAGASLTGARKLAREARDQLADGLDPITERDQARESSRSAERAAKAAKEREQLTLARAARDYHERVIETRLSSKHAAQWISSLENHVPARLWHAPAASVSAPALLEALSEVRSFELEKARVPETLRRIRQRLDAVFEDLIFRGQCTTNPAAAVRRKIRETLPRKRAGAFAALNHREAPAFLDRLRAAAGTAARCLEFAVLTAARTGEAISTEWPEFDLNEGTWTIPASKMKAGEPHVVYLSKRAREIVREQIGADNLYIFPSPMKLRQPLSNMALLATLDHLEMRGKTTVHGLCRATFSTWAHETAAARPDVIEACLAHREQDRVKAAYNHARFTEERRQLMDAWATYLEGERRTLLYAAH